MKGLFNYRYDEKNKWRKDVWDEISARIPADYRRNSIVLYLGGEEDLDRQVAIQRGFRSDNLLLIEIDKQKTAKLREFKKIVIKGDIRSVLNEWPPKHDVAVFFADFCSGLDLSFIESFRHSFYYNDAFRHSIFVFNFQRGREKTIEFMRLMADLHEAPFIDMKHRGSLFLWCALGNCMKMVRPRFWDYKSQSGSIYMDSVLFENPLIFERKDLNRAPKNLISFLYEKWNAVKESSIELTQIEEEIIKTHIGESWWRKSEKKIVENVKRQITAALAIRTMRICGKLDHSPTF